MGCDQKSWIDIPQRSCGVPVLKSIVEINMTISVDPITRKKLIIVKQLYQNAIIQSASHHNITNRLLSVIGFDLAIETVLRTIIGSLDSSKKPAGGFQGLVQQGDTVLLSAGYNPIPDKANIQYIHSIRNDAQHKAKYPNESDVSDCRIYARDFLRKIIAELWNLDFEKISLTDVIQHEKVRQYLIDAELALAQSNYLQAIQSASAGLTFTLNRVESAIVGHMPSFANGLLLVDSFGKPMSDSNSRDAYRAFERMQDTLLYITLGMNYSDFMRYKKLAGHVVFTIDGTPHYHGQTENIEQKDAEFVVAYSTNTVVQVESIVGNIDAPFGKEYWY